MTLKAEVYQGKVTRRWYWSVFDTDHEFDTLSEGSAPAWEWDHALNAARESLRVQAFTARVNGIAKALALGTTVHRHTMGLPHMPALVWEGDYA